MKKEKGEKMTDEKKKPKRIFFREDVSREEVMKELKAFEDNCIELGRFIQFSESAGIDDKATRKEIDKVVIQSKELYREFLYAQIEYLLTLSEKVKRFNDETSVL